MENIENVSLIRLAVRRLQDLATNRVEADLMKKASLAMVDYLGAIASGLPAPSATHLTTYAALRRQGNVQESFCWATGKDCMAETAAFVNAAVAHSAIRDDMHLKSNSHIGSVVLSAAFSVAQRDSWTGEQLAKAIIGGYEIASLLGTAVQQSESYNRHFRPSGICGAFGAAGAAVTASLVSSQMSEDTAVNALAFAANMASGVNQWAFSGGQEIYVEMASASQAGIVAFDLASAGMVCSETLKGLQAPLGQGLQDVKFKPAPGCNYAQTPLAVALEIAKNHHIKSEDIESVTVLCTRGAKNYPGCDNSGPSFTNVQQTKMSIQYGVSAVLCFGKISEKTFQQFDDQAIIQLVARCKVEMNSGFDESFREGRQPARIEVKLKSGHSDQITAEFPDVPWLDEEHVIKRFHQEVAKIIPSTETRDDLLNAIRNLQSMRTCHDIFDLFKTATLPQSQS